MTRLNVVAVTGSLQAPSKTIALVEAIVAELGTHIDLDSHLIKLSDIGPLFAGALSRSELTETVEVALRRIETADLLVVASPVYRASFTGLFKHLFDFVDQDALIDTPILLAASGGSERHALIIEHQLRPLFAFFQALTLPLGIYAHDSDFTDYQVSSSYLADRISKVVSRSLPIILANIDGSVESADRGLGTASDTASGTAFDTASGEALGGGVDPITEREKTRHADELDTQETTPNVIRLVS